MQESMVKFVLSLLALLFLALGGVFLVIPEWYVTFAEAEAVNVGWLRGLGAAMVSVQGFGLAASAFRRRDTNPLLVILALASTVEAGVIWFSLVSGEYSIQALWTVILPGVVVTAAALLIWGAWASRRRSVKLLGNGPERIAADDHYAPAGGASAAGANDAERGDRPGSPIG